MRIISGFLKGRRITAPRKLPVRPTTDMAKEALFNILNNQYYFDEISVLDLFAGTGNMSYEFASRGTERITAVDNNYGCIRFINDTAEVLNIPITTIKSDVYTYLENTTQPFDIIFADPPYNFDIELFTKLPLLVFQNNMLTDNGVLVVEHSKHTDLSTLDYYVYTKTYGGSAFSFFKNNGNT